MLIRPIASQSLLMLIAVLVTACAGSATESASVSTHEHPAVTVDALFAVLRNELPAEAARNIESGEPAEAFAKAMRALLDISDRNSDWHSAVAEVQDLASWLFIDLSDMEAVVTRVTDGDTITVRFGDGTTATVRYADMDTPAVGEACASEATALNRAMVDGRTVTLKLPFDPENRLDRYGRLVRHVWVYYPPANGDVWVNHYLVYEGLAVSWGEALHPGGELRPMARAELDAMLANAGCLWRP